MKRKKVRDLMVPIAEYAVVSQDATLRDAILELEAAQARYEKNLCEKDEHPHHHRAILVVDENDNPVGKISQWVALRAIEPKYDRIFESGGLERFGFGSDYLLSMAESHGLWMEPLDSLCRKAAHVKVKDVMYTPDEGEYVEAKASLEEGIHRMVMGHHQSLLVTRRNRVVGVLRLVDLFSEIRDRIKSS